MWCSCSCSPSHPSIAPHPISTLEDPGARHSRLRLTSSSWTCVCELHDSPPCYQTCASSGWRVVCATPVTSRPVPHNRVPSGPSVAASSIECPFESTLRCLALRQTSLALPTTLDEALSCLTQ